jgi:hypothetical protein
LIAFKLSSASEQVTKGSRSTWQRRHQKKKLGGA